VPHRRETDENMTTATPAQYDAPGMSFRHEAVLYAGDDEYADRIGGFLRDGVDAGEPVLAAVATARIDLLRRCLGGSARSVTFVDMDALGANPARILPAWRTFAEPHLAGGRHIRGVGEPISPGRSDAELVECHRHEALLNLAFDGGGAWWLVCPYDVGALPEEVIAEARCTHPLVWGERRGQPNVEYRGRFASAEPFVVPLPDPPAAAEEVFFTVGDLRALRAAVADAARGWGLPEARVADLVLATGEVAANSVRHGGGGGSMRIWFDAGAAVCQIRDAGFIAQPLAGREPPVPGDGGGYGLWLANQVCDLVQIRSSSAGTTVRLHVRAAV
jgi:anti-sigma regulatory factor (Ser/Thr protein kinase)